MKPLTLTTAPLKGETEPQVWLVELPRFYPSQMRLECIPDELRRFRLMVRCDILNICFHPSAVPAAMATGYAAEQIRGASVYRDGKHETVRPFAIRGRELGRFTFTQYPSGGRAFSGQSVDLTKGQIAALSDAFEAALSEEMNCPKFQQACRQHMFDQANEATREHMASVQGQLQLIKNVL